MKFVYRLFVLLALGCAVASTALAQDDDPAAEWKQQAQDALALEVLPDYDPTSPPDDPTALILRTRVIAHNYYSLYELNPAAYKWSGLAALVTCSIYTTLASTQGQVAPPPFDELPTVLTDGHLAVYQDLYWQHLAYASGGLAEMERLYEAEALDESGIAAWRMIDAGLQSDDPDAVWAGNLELLRREQELVLQPVVYDGHETLWAILQTIPAAMISPVPNDPAFFAADAGEFAVFEDRWAWVAEHVFPAWRAFEADPDAANVYLKAYNPCWIPPDDDPRRS